MKLSDINASGGIEFDEFLVLMSMVNQSSKQFDILMNAFEEFDVLETEFKIFSRMPHSGFGNFYSSIEGLFERYFDRNCISILSQKGVSITISN